MYSLKSQYKQQSLFCLILLGNTIKNSVNYRLEIRFQQTNKFEIGANLPEHNK